MAAGPGHGMAAMDNGHMRSSQADRERAIDVLKAAFAEGRLDQDEHTERAGRVYSSRTYADLAVLTADLPAGPLGTLAPHPPWLPERMPPPGIPVSARARTWPPLILAPTAVLLVATVAGLPIGPFGIGLLALCYIAMVRIVRSR
jgi:Domain of unknown function (DUF1707)